MNVIISGKQIDLSDGMKDAIETKLSRLDKYFNEDVSPQVTVSSSKGRNKIEVTIPMKGNAIRAQAVNYDFYSAIDEVVSKLGRQLRKYKTRLKRKGNESIRFENVEDYFNQETKEEKIVKRKSFVFDMMSEDEAILQMEMLDHNFFVFTNADTDKICVLYKREDGHYGLIESEI